MPYVAARNAVWEIESTPYWHVTSEQDILLHNARVAEGIIWSVSAAAQLPGLEKATTRYGVAGSG